MKETIKIEDSAIIRALVGTSDANIRKLRNAFGISILARGDIITFEGDERKVGVALQAVKKAIRLIGRQGDISPDEFDSILLTAKEIEANGNPEAITVFQKGRVILPKTKGQTMFIQALKGNTITFGIGPAGTGKTYLSVAVAVSFLKKGRINRIVLVRPAVEAGEKLGFLPGDLRDKVNPYLRPLFDSLGDMIESDHIARLYASDVIEVAPLAFMRGRTLNRSFVILDEAQNCTISQMKMFLTRIGYDSIAAITGDITQSDLPNGEMSGLVHAHHILRNIPGISFVVLKHSDIVRHPLVQQVVDAYERDERSGLLAGSGFRAMQVDEE